MNKELTGDVYLCKRDHSFYSNNKRITIKVGDRVTILNKSSKYPDRDDVYLAKFRDVRFNCCTNWILAKVDYKQFELLEN